MDHNGEHHVARIDDTVTPASLHERAEAVAVPDFDYLGQTVGAIAVGLTRRHETGRHETAKQETGRHATGRKTHEQA